MEKLVKYFVINIDLDSNRIYLILKEGSFADYIDSNDYFSSDFSEFFVQPHG